MASDVADRVLDPLTPVSDRRAMRDGRLTYVAGTVTILALAIALVYFVGLGEAYRAYPRLELERLAAQGDVVRKSMEPFLLAGLPVEQYPGFDQTVPLIASDQSITAVYLLGARGQIVDSHARPEIAGEASLLQSPFSASNLQVPGQDQVTESQTHYRVALELRSKFEKVGDLVILMPKSAVTDRITASFIGYVVPGAIAALLVFAAVVLSMVWRSEMPRNRSIGLAYGVAYFAVALVVVYALLGLYSTGIRDKTSALATSLGTRLSAPLAVGLDLSDLGHLDEVLREYQTAYPDLSYVALTDGGVTLIHTDPTRVGSPWVPYPNHYEQSAELKPVRAAESARYVVHVGIPESAILDRLWRGAKNFVVLFVASGFLAVLLLNLLNSLSRMSRGRAVTVEARREQQMSIVQPFLFLGVFVEGLSAAFLPLHLQRLAQDATVDTGIVSTQFTIYFAAYALCLLPAGRFVEGGRSKPVLVFAVALQMASLVLMAMVTNPYALYLVRAMAGTAQGLILTGVQSYFFDMLPREQQTRGAATLGLTYNSALISASALGALMSVYVGTTNVFVLAAVISVAVLAYAIRLLPGLAVVEALRSEPSFGAGAVRPTFAQSLRQAVRDDGFLKALFLVGVPAKAASTGVTAFALPLLLARQAFPQDDIGQIVMFYPAGVVFASFGLARIVNTKVNPGQLLFYGALGGGLGLILVGMLGWEGLAATGVPGLGTIVLISGMLTLGAAHGFVVGPIVGYIAGSGAARSLGRSPANSLYRTLERIGHMSGPILVGALLQLNGGSALTIAWVGVGAIVLGVLFRTGSARGVDPGIGEAT
jgi:predicted MFS family arabinose efflux permease